MAVLEHLDSQSKILVPTKGTNERVNFNMGTPLNEVDTTVIEVNNLTATVISAVNTSRQLFTVILEPTLTDVAVAIRYYPAGDDDIFQGTDVLVRNTSGNTNLFHPRHQMTGVSYYGEISAISSSGLVNLIITEGGSL